MAAKLKAVRDVGEAAASFRFYNANVETIAFSTANGGAGFSGISANFYPQLHSWLVKVRRLRLRLDCKMRELNNAFVCSQ